MSKTMAINLLKTALQETERIGLLLTAAAAEIAEVPYTMGDDEIVPAVLACKPIVEYSVIDAELLRELGFPVALPPRETKEEPSSPAPPNGAPTKGRADV